MQHRSHPRIGRRVVAANCEGDSQYAMPGILQRGSALPSYMKVIGRGPCV